MAISSTTLTSRWRSGVSGLITSQAPVARSTFSGPVRHATHAIAPATAVTIMPIHGTRCR